MKIKYNSSLLNSFIIKYKSKPKQQINKKSVLQTQWNLSQCDLLIINSSQIYISTFRQSKVNNFLFKKYFENTLKK